MPDSNLQIVIGVDAGNARAGAEQVKSALAGIGPQIEALGKTFGELGKNLKGGLEGFAQIGRAITGLGREGGQLQGVVTSLKSVGEAASGLGGVAVAVGQVALSAAAATAEWAQRTQDSSTASAQAKQNAANLNGAIDVAGKTFSAVGDTLANAFAPVLTTVVDALTGLAKGFEDSYAKGGAAKAIVDTLIFGFKLLAAGVEIAIGVVIGIIEAVRSQIQQWKDQFDIVGMAVEGTVDVLQIRFQTLGQVFRDVFSGDFGKAVGDYEAGLARIDKRTQDTVASIHQQLASLEADRITGAKAVLGVVASVKTDVGNLFSGPQHVQRDGLAGKPDAVAARGAHRGGASPGSGAAAPVAEPRACDPAAAAACETAAQSERTAVAAQANQQRVGAHAEANAAMAASDSGATAAAASKQAQQVADAQGSDRAKVESNAAANARIDEANDKTLKQFEASVKKLANSFADGLVKMAEGAESFGQVMRKIGQQILDDVFRIVVGAVEKWAWGETEKVLASTQAQALLNALGLRELAAAIRNDVAKATSAATTEHARTAATTSGVTARAAAENSGFFAQIITKLASLLGIHIGTEVAKTQVTVSAASARAGASGVASFAEAPWPIDMGAVAFGGAMSAAARGFGSLSVAAGGYDIPAGVNPLTQLHAQEMVLPARLANPMRDMLASFGSGSASAVGGHSFSFGDTHIHGAPNMSPADFRQALAEHRASVAEAVAGALHSGWRPSYRQPVGAL